MAVSGIKVPRIFFPGALSFFRHKTLLASLRHWPAVSSSTAPSGFLESRTARPPSGNAAISTQFPEVAVEYDDLTQLRSLLIEIIHSVGSSRLR